MTRAQLRILEPMMRGKLLYGPMADPRFSSAMGSATRSPHWGGAGGWWSGPSISLMRGHALLDAGLIEHTVDKYPLGYYRISKAGRAAVRAWKT